MTRKTYEFCELDCEVFHLLKKLNYSPDVIFDVGAAKGYWSHLVNNVYPDACYHLFEPLIDHLSEYSKPMKENLRQHSSFTLHKLALGESCGEIILHLFPNPYASTTLNQDGDHPDIRRILVPMLTLDSLVYEGRIPVPQVLKIDVQGSELSILKGAEQILPEIDVLLLECWLYRVYGPGNPLLLEIANWVADFGFCLWDVADSWRTEKGILGSLDCVFLNASTMAKRIDYDFALPQP